MHYSAPTGTSLTRDCAT